MDKFAQERSIFNKIREKINQPASMVEGFFKPELDRIMTDLRLADDNIRSVLVGSKVGKPDVEITAGRSIKDLLKSARSNFNRREYMTGVADLGEFHKRLFDAVKLIDKLDLSVNQIHHNFLFKSLSPKQRENIRGLQEYMKSASDAVNEPYFIKEAGIMDFFHNIGTRRGWSLAAWEKKYPKVVKDLRDGGLKLLDIAEATKDNVLALLKEMAAARATRKVDDYMDAAKKIKYEYAKFDGGDKGFRAYYHNIVLPYLKKQEELEKEEAKKAPPPDVKSDPKAVAPTTSVPGMGGGYVTVAPGMGASTQAPSQPPSELTAVPAGPPKPGEILANEKDVEMLPDEPPITERSPAPVHTAHANFYNSLHAMGNEAPRILASYITKYAKSIQGDDPETAIKLFSIVKQLKG